MNEPKPVAAQMRKALRALRSGHALLAEGDTEGACNRAVGALDRGTTCKTHRGLIGAFSQHLILTHRLPDRLGRSFAKVHDARLVADYTSEAPDEATTGWIVGEADAFISMIQTMLET